MLLWLLLISTSITYTALHQEDFIMKDTEKFKFAIYKILDKESTIDELSGHLELKGYEKVTCYNSKQILFISKGEPESPFWKSFLEKITPSPSILELFKKNPSFVLLNLKTNRVLELILHPMETAY